MRGHVKDGTVAAWWALEQFGMNDLSSTLDKTYGMVSVIIPCFKTDPEILGRCIEAVLGQENLKAGLELILVDNNPLPLLAEQLPHHSSLLIIHEPRPGSYVARNRGIKASRGSILAFTDADCMPTKQWLREGMETMQGDPAVDYVAGNIKTFFKISEKPNSLEVYDSLVYLRQEAYLKEGHYAATANLLAKRFLFESVGMFDEEHLSGGDQEWGKRVWHAGYAQGFSARALVYHKGRSTFFELAKKGRRIEGGRFMLEDPPSPVMVQIKRIWSDAVTKLRIVSANRSLCGRWRIHFIFVALVALHLVSLVEYLRLRMGGSPQR